MYGGQKKVSGIVIDGLVRDRRSIAKLDFPVFSVGSTPRGPTREGPGEINIPIIWGGVGVNPGDIIVGDADGVVVIPKAAVENVTPKAIHAQQKDEEKVREAKEGQLERDWVDRTLGDLGCEIIDDISPLINGVSRRFRE